MLAFQATLISAQSLPQCVIDAFPDLNITEVAQYRPDEKSGGLVCDLCTALFTEIQHILLDGEIEDAVSSNRFKTSYFQITAHCRILSEIRTYFSMSQKSNLMLEFQAHICWVITLDYKVRLGQVKSEFN